MVYEGLTSKPCFLNLFWLDKEYYIQSQSLNGLLICVLSNNHLRLRLLDRR